jgi:pullulanase-type alpha-1,6-glucosidase
MRHRASPRALHLFVLFSLLISTFAPIFTPAAAQAALQDPGLAALPSDHTPSPAAVTLVGDLQSEIGCAGDWDPGCVTSGLLYDAGDDVWQQTFNVPGGNFEYKVALNGSWDENYGANAQLNGPNIPLAVDFPAAVKFYYDHKSHWITSNRTSIIAVAPGNFQEELGCAGDWDPSCLRSWLQDPDGDGIYTFSTSALPAGDYEGKVAINESWDLNYGAGGQENGPNLAFTVPSDGARVDFAWNSVTKVPTIQVDSLPAVDLASIAAVPPRNPVDDEVFYFVMPDRFANGDPSNDQGGLSGDRYVTGFDPTDKGFYHGGDLAGLTAKLDYLEQMGVTAIWMTPVFKNKPVQGSGSDISAGYHGYWVTDFTQFDPHFGTNAELQALIEQAHAKGIKVFFDIILNHTADVVQYAEGVYDYRSKADYPYRDADGLPFDDRDFVGTGTFPELDPAISFPYTPVVPEAETNVKVPAWLNNPIYYHNRGNSTFSGENSLYGDFFGLDDLFTEHPAVVEGMINIHKFWISNFDIDGFRVDTVKHVNAEFWDEFTPAIIEHAKATGKPEFFVFGEVFSGNPELLSFYTTDIDMQAVLDFRFQEHVRTFVSAQGSAQNMQSLFAGDDWFTDEDSNVYSLPTFIGNHDRGRFGYFLNADNNGGLPDAEMLSRSKLAHGLMYFARGVPVTYYGDEQGFTGDGGDKDARQDMFPSQVASYNDDNLIGTDMTTADDNFDPSHPLYQAFDQYAAVYDAHLALQRGAQIHRYAADGPGIYAFSRIDRDEKVEYLVAVNNSSSSQTADIQTFYGAGAQFNLLLAEGSGAPANLTTGANGAVGLTVPALGFVVYQAGAAVPASPAAPAVTIANLVANQEVQLGFQDLDGNRVPKRLEVAADVAGNQYAEVTFAVRAAGTEEFTVIGVDDNAPYRVFYDASGWPQGTKLEFLAVVNDLNGHYSGAFVSGIVANYTEEPVLADYNYAVIHYLRSDGDYGDHTTGNYNDFWGLHLWGDAIDPSEVTEWTKPKPFLGEDAFGRFAWIKLQDATKDVNFIVHRGDVKDGTDQDRKFNPASDGPEIWLKQGDPNFYTSQAAAQGYVTIHYSRPDGVYTGWGLHLWGDGLADGVGTEWATPRPFDGIDDFGAYWNVPIKDATLPVNFIIHKGDEKDPGPDQSLLPETTPAVWIKSANETIFPQRCAADDTVILHYHRPAGDYGDFTSPNYQDFWGLHTWGAAADPGWTTPRRPVDQDTFGPVFVVPLENPAVNLNYILHRGDNKDPGPDQTLDADKYGCEVWQVQGADPENPYILPIIRGAVSGGDLSLEQAHWIDRSTILWDIEPKPGYTYALHYAAEGGITLGDNQVQGGQSIPLFLDPTGPSAAQKAQWPHLASFAMFRLRSQDLPLVTEILKGQIAVSASLDGFVVDATGVQIPGVLDDLYTYDGDLGLVWNGGVPTISVWAPTARSVKLHLFDTAGSVPAAQILPMTPGAQGVWSITGEAAWKNKYYLFEVEVYVPSTGKVERNIVTDPYSLGLAMNSTRSMIVDLDDPSTKPSAWGSVPKPPLGAPEDIKLYELHVRDFSISDATVPEAARGTFKAFTYPNSNGMVHLKTLADAGLTHVHLLPVFDIATINENKAERVEPNVPDAGPDSPEQQAAVMAVADEDGFNWGYDPYHYTVPEGSYSTDPEGVTRIVEFREMVQALHASGLRVVMDVVYNHTHASGQGEASVLDKIVPGYYHRLNLDGVVETSTCCANTASEHAMFEKLMIDSLVIWAEQYGVDGFRFDLMGHHMKSNMVKVQETLQAIDPTIYVYGEGWNFGEVANNARGVNATQLNLPGTGIGTFNDRLRDAVRGGGPFDGGDNLVRNQGFINGLWYDPNELNQGDEEEKARLLLYADQIRVGLAGNLADYEFVDRTGNVVKGSQVDYNGSPTGYTQDPQENIVYVEAHDNQTLYDNNAYKLPLSTSMADRVRAQNLGLDFTLLAQGIPFLHAGEEILRSKSMDRNSYNSGDWFNKLDWTYASNNFGVGLPPAGENEANWPLIGPRLANPALWPGKPDIQANFTHALELLELRDSSPLFRLQTEADIMARVQFLNTGPDQVPGLIVMSISDKIASLPDLDPQHEQIVVLFNATDTAQSFKPAGAAGQGFRLHPVQADSADAVVRSATYDAAAGEFKVPARTTAVFVQGDGTKITIVKDARPDSKRNFRFEGDFGNFNLRDWSGQGGSSGNIPSSRTFDVTPGSYTVRERTFNDWYFAGITCDVPGRGDVNMANAEVRITVFAGDHVTCTFVNEQWAAILARVYFDRNANGQLDLREPGLNNWWLTLYDANGVQVRWYKTVGTGKTNFWTLPPGSYTLCGEVRDNWWNTQPGTGDADFGNRPCYQIEAGPASVTEAWYGYAQTVPQLNGSSAAGGLLQYPNPYWVDTEEPVDAPFVDPDIDVPFSARPMFMPLITR